MSHFFGSSDWFIEISMLFGARGKPLISVSIFSWSMSFSVSSSVSSWVSAVSGSFISISRRIDFILTLCGPNMMPQVLGWISSVHLIVPDNTFVDSSSIGSL